MSKDKTVETLVTNKMMKWTTCGIIVQVQINDEPLLRALEKKIRANIDPKLSYQTNVRAGMTHWDHFKTDEDFKKLLLHYFNLCGDAGLYADVLDKKERKYHFLVQNCWGTVMKKGDFVFNHHHLGTDYSTVLYFDSHAPLCTDVGLLPTKRGLIISLPSYCFHSVKKITKDINRCTLAWNWSFTKGWDEKDPNEQDLNYLGESP